MNTKRLYRIFKKAALYISLTVAFFLIAGVLIVYFFEDKIVQFAIDEINKNLNTKIEVQDIRLSLWKKFPQASLEFKQVSCEDTYEQKMKLLTAKSVFLSFNVWDIFSGKYIFKRIDIEEASVNIFIDKKGKRNFDILKRKKQEEKGIPNHFQFNQVGLKNIHIDYENAEKSQLVLLNISKLKMSGRFSEKIHKAQITSDFFVELVKIRDTEYLHNRNLKLNTVFENNTNTETLSIQKAELAIESLHITGSGTVKTDSTGFVDLKLTGEKLNVQSFISLLPEEWKKFENEYKSNGNFYLNVSIVGNTGQKQSPDMIIDFGIQDGEVTYKPSGLQIKRMQLKGAYQSTKNGHAQKLTISSLIGHLEQSEITGSFSYEWGKDKILSFATKSSIQLAELHSFFPIPGIKSMEGFIDINASFQGQSSGNQPFTIYDYQQSYLTGTAKLKQVSIIPDEQKHHLTKITGLLSFANSDATLSNVSCMLGSSDINLDGTLHNLPAYLLLPDAPLQIQAKFHSNHFKLEELLEAEDKKNTAAPKWKVKLPERVDLSLALSINKLSFNKFIASDISGAATFKNQYLSIDNLQMNAFGGLTSLRGTARMLTDTSIMVTCQSSLRQIQIKRLFEECDNFGQQTVTQENLSGKLDADVDLSVAFTQQLSALLPTLKVASNFTIQEGEIMNIKSLESLSKFIRLEELKHIRFATLSNEILIEDKIIHMPEMEIQSSAINIHLSGTHSFDNIIDYRFNVLLKDLLAQKFKRNRKQDEFGEIIEDNDRGARIFLKMTGQAKNPVVGYDGKSAQEKIKEDMKKEKQELKQILFEEFGWFKKDSTIQKNNTLSSDKKEKKKNKELQSEEFEFE